MKGRPERVSERASSRVGPRTPTFNGNNELLSEAIKSPGDAIGCSAIQHKMFAFEEKKKGKKKRPLWRKQDKARRTRLRAAARRPLPLPASDPRGERQGATSHSRAASDSKTRPKQTKK